MISIVMPAHNEADFLDASVRAVVAGLRGSQPDGEVVVVENGSTDATVAVAERLAGELPGVKVLSLPRPDYGAALRAGFLAAQGDIVVNFDVDYYDMDFLDAAVALIRRPGGPDVVVGSKRAAGSSDERALPRRLITAAFALVLRRGFGLGVSDTHGIKAMRREPLLPLVSRCRVATDLFDTELVLRAERAGLDVTEVPVAVRESRPSRTSIFRRGVRSVGGLARLRLALWQDRV
ncbi:MAG: glycosyltransferase family 2 protein [Actinomycetota bacterium]|nr:glycosyltransferase family 2 protein [Actinomycetota bacterium]